MVEAWKNMQEWRNAICLIRMRKVPVDLVKLQSSDDGSIDYCSGRLTNPAFPDLSFRRFKSWSILININVFLNKIAVHIFTRILRLNKKKYIHIICSNTYRATNVAALDRVYGDGCKIESSTIHCKWSQVLLINDLTYMCHVWVSYQL